MAVATTARGGALAIMPAAPVAMACGMRPPGRVCVCVCVHWMCMWKEKGQEAGCNSLLGSALGELTNNGIKYLVATKARTLKGELR